jgi:hypothetical protein
LFFKSGNFGSRYTGHKHDVLNSFVLILNGERLVPEAPGSNRETCYHSTILVNGKGQTRNSTGTIVQSGQVNGVLFVIAEASNAYSDRLSYFRRTAFLVPDRFVAIGDVLKGPVGNQYEWKLQTSKTPDLSLDQKSGRITGKKSALQVQVVLPGNATLSIGKSCGPCLSANVTAAESSATYFVVLAPADMPVSAKVIGKDVQVTTAEGIYTFRVTDNGWESTGNTRAREARHEGN